MKTPISDFVKSYAERQSIRLHMPGHKGIGDVERYDITEIFGADSLYEASGIIRESEKNASELFGAETFYSTEGSSLSIRAMLYIVNNYSQNREKEPLILAARNAHKTFVGAAALLGIDVEWIYPETDGGYLSLPMNAKKLASVLDSMERSPTALYITSPDYLGYRCNISEIAELCHARDILLLVDNAHGAYLKFLSPSEHPIDLGADIVCDSAHKTLPALTGAAYLHISKASDPSLRDLARVALGLFGSTSPSYLILASLDRVNAYLADGYSEKLDLFARKVDGLKSRLISHGYTLYGDEPLKLTVEAKKYGYTADDLARILSSYGIVHEFSDKDHLVLMLTPEITDEELLTLEKALLSIPAKNEIPDSPPGMKIPIKALPMRCAMLSPSELLPVSECIGRVLGAVTVGCPPAVPILALGEIVEADMLPVFEYYGITELRVIKR